MKFDIDYVKKSLEYSLKNSTLMEFDLDDEKWQYFDLKEYINLAKSIYDRKESDNVTNVIYIDTDISSSKKEPILFNTILYKTDRDFHSKLCEKVESLHKDINDKSFSNEELEKLFEWYENISQKVKEKILPSLVSEPDGDILITLVKFFIAIAINSPKLIIIQNPKNLDLFSLILINRLFEVNEFLNSKNIDIGISFVYLNKKSKDDSFFEDEFKPRVRGAGDGFYSFTTLKSHSISDKIDNSKTIQEQMTKHSNAPRLYNVYYGTNRKYENGSYTNSRDNKINYGKCEILIPKSHKIGSTGSWWKRWIPFFEDNRLKINGCFQKDENSFFKEIRDNIGKNDALIYIHGYNNSFDEAVIRAGQIGFDLNPDLLTACFSWPSKGKKKDYPDDEATIDASEKYIIEFLENFSKNLNPEKIHIIAHSMGNRGLLRAFDKMFNEVSSDFKFGQIFLAAPDIDIDLFKNLANAYPSLSKRATLYVSKKDFAIKLSKKFHDYPRVGLLPPVTIVDKIDTIEVVNLDISSFGHGYIYSARDLLQDMFNLIKENKSPNDRYGLEKVQSENYWRFRE